MNESAASRTTRFGHHAPAFSRRALWMAGKKFAAALSGVAFWSGIPAAQTAAAPGPSIDTVSGCRVVDGDTLRCGRERIRLLGIDAPELPGHCPRGRRCAPGDAFAATTSLRRAADSLMRIERIGQDRYGRSLALVRGPQGDLSCWQLRHGQAIYKPYWDNGSRIARSCPDAARGR